MRFRRSLFAICIGAGVAGLIFQRAEGPRRLAAATATSAPKGSTVPPTDTPTPSPTPTLPSARVLLAQAAGASAAMGSVLEFGAFHSSNDDVMDGFSFWANFSWRKAMFHDRHIFAKSLFLNRDLGYAGSLRRAAVGPLLGEHTHGIWSCVRSSASKNSALWQPPRFPLHSPRMMTPTTVAGHPAWDVRGIYRHKVAGRHSRLRVDVYIDRQTSRFIRAAEVGTVSVRGRRSARIRGRVDYRKYGGPVDVKIPTQCNSRR